MIKMIYRNFIKRISKIFLVLTMLFSICFTVGNTNTVNAYDVNIPKQFTRVKNITYPENALLLLNSGLHGCANIMVNGPTV